MLKTGHQVLSVSFCTIAHLSQTMLDRIALISQLNDRMFKEAFGSESEE